MNRFLIILTFQFCWSITHSQDKIFKTYNGKINFISVAPLETIKAGSKKLNGIINLSTNNFSFKVNMISFEGFNNPLQKEHFFENYMETEQFPESTFNGKIIEPIKSQGKQKLRAKGNLTIHGVSNEVLIDVNIDYSNNNLQFDSAFEVLLEDYNISVPKIVRQKISSNIKVVVSGTMSNQ